MVHGYEPKLYYQLKIKDTYYEYFDIIPYLENKYKIRFHINENNGDITVKFDLSRRIGLFLEEQSWKDLFLDSGEDRFSIPDDHKINFEYLASLKEFKDITDFNQQTKTLLINDPKFKDKSLFHGWKFVMEFY
jgi:hypothetical protein